ncbi:MAG: tetratricopeptide repeat protein [Arenimonas sp.]
MSFIAELKRRNVIRMAGLYLVGSWLITQVAATLLPVFDAPSWTIKAVVILLFIGFIPALVISWIFELTPEGLKRDGEIAPEFSIGGKTAQKMEHLIVALFAVALIFFGFDKFVLAPQRDAALVKQTTQQVTAKVAAIKSPISSKSIAVLAFADMSPGKDNEFFSDGVSEEILNALSQVKDMKVAGRTSSFYFKDRKENLQTIGSILGVANVLEGSVRKQGDKVRITAQLVQVKDGYHLWSKNFDGDMKDVFALQEKIARSITDELNVVLSGKQIRRLVNTGTENTEAFTLFLQATEIFNRRDGSRFNGAIKLLEQAIELDPRFARAHARLAALNAISGNYKSVDLDASMAAVELHAKHASELDSKLSEPYAALGLAYYQRRRFRESRQAFDSALKIDPNDATVNFWNGLTLISTGYLKQGTAALDRSLALDPMLPNALLWRGRAYVFDGDLKNAERLMNRAADGGLSFVGSGKSWLELARGNKVAAREQLVNSIRSFISDFPPEEADTFADACLGDTKAKERALALIDAYLAKKPKVISAIVPYVLIRSGEVSSGLRLIEGQPTSNDAMISSDLFVMMREVLASPDFPEFARKIGWAELWDSYGPPDMCSKNAAGDYVCEQSKK